MSWEGEMSGLSGRSASCLLEAGVEGLVADFDGRFRGGMCVVAVVRIGEHWFLDEGSWLAEFPTKVGWWWEFFRCFGIGFLVAMSIGCRQTVDHWSFGIPEMALVSSSNPVASSLVLSLLEGLLENFSQRWLCGVTEPCFPA